MNCLDCERDARQATPAAAICMDHNAGACRDRLVIRQHRLTRVEPLIGHVLVGPLAHRVRGRGCDAAWQSAHAPARRRTRAERWSA